MRIRIRIYSVLKNHPNTNTIWLKNICQIRRIRISLFGLNYSNTIWIPNYSLTSGSLQEKENKDSETFDCLIGWLAKGAFVIQVPSSKRKQRFKKEFPSIDFYLLFTLSGKISTITLKNTKNWYAIDALGAILPMLTVLISQNISKISQTIWNISKISQNI